MKGSVLSGMLCCTFLLNACQQNIESVEVPAMASFKLVNGSSISDATADDYNPVLQQLANGTLVLAFVSNRSCSSGCSGQNIFITTSTTAYASDGKLPAFNQPQVFTFNGAVANVGTNRITMAALTSGNQIDLFFQQKGGSIQHTGYISPVSAVPINITFSFGSATIGAYNCAGLSMLGLDGAGLMIATASTTGPISRFDSTNAVLSCISTPVNPLPSTGMAPALNISIVRSSDIGISEGFFVVDSQSKLSAQTASIKGPQIKSFTDALTTDGLTLTNASVFNASQPSGDLLIFSASSISGGPSDLYAVTNKTPATMWLKYTKYGTQPTP